MGGLLRLAARWIVNGGICPEVHVGPQRHKSGVLATTVQAVPGPCEAEYGCVSGFCGETEAIGLCPTQRGPLT